MRDLDLAVGVLVDRERVDHAHGVALPELLELGDDLAVELWVLEAEHDQLHRPDGHGAPPRLGILSLHEPGRSPHRPDRMKRTKPTLTSAGRKSEHSHDMTRKVATEAEDHGMTLPPTLTQRDLVRLSLLLCPSPGKPQPSSGSTSR